MSRSEEKSQAMLNRWWALKAAQSGQEIPRKRSQAPGAGGPRAARNAAEAERGRSAVAQERSARIAEIQDESIGEERIRALNDEINRLSARLHRWEVRLVELGGMSHSSAPTAVLDAGVKLPGHRGHYRYYGAAKSLPGVREKLAEPDGLTEAEIRAREKRRRKVILAAVDSEYYAMHTDPEAEAALLRLESALESARAETARDSWLQAHPSGIPRPLSALDWPEAPIPTMAQLEESLLQREKQDLLNLYGI